MLDDWSMWEIVAYVDGRNEAYARDEKPEAMTNEEFDDLLRMHNLPVSVN